MHVAAFIGELQHYKNFKPSYLSIGKWAISPFLSDQVTNFVGKIPSLANEIHVAIAKSPQSHVPSCFGPFLTSMSALAPNICFRTFSVASSILE